MKVERLFTSADRPIEEQIEWKIVRSEIVGKDGPIFSMDAVEVPVQWSQGAIDIFASKYLRRAGVPSKIVPNPAHDHPIFPNWLLPSVATEGTDVGSETSAKQVFHRLAGCWTYWGWREGMFLDGTMAHREIFGNSKKDPVIVKAVQNQSEEAARSFYDELYWMLAMQFAAPNSPQWFNTGLHWAYGITGSGGGNWAIDHEGDSQTPAGGAYPTTNAYERPQPHACFIQPVADDLVNEGGIMDLWVREVRLFKGGSGTGSNFSAIRGKGERLSSGGVSSGLMSFLRIGDQAAGSIKSGGTTRRAAKMVIVGLDHPEIEDFIEWKVREERKALAMNVGSEVLNRDDDGEVYSYGWEGEAISSVSGQNSNNSVRVTEEFMRRVDADEPWDLTARTTGEVVKTLSARGLWEKICRSAWASADPGVQFHDTIQAWHTCSNDGPINASNPCSEYLFLDNTACNLASLNLVKFLNSDGTIAVEAYEHAVRLWTMVLEISVEMASFPSREIAEMSERYRTLGLGVANLGGLLMRSALPYDSDEGRALAAGLQALMTGVAYRTSVEMASELGPFAAWEANAEPMKRVLRNHARASRLDPALIEGAGQTSTMYEGLNIDPMPLNHQLISKELSTAIKHAWVDVCGADSFRNAQVTLTAPTGTIRLVMDCETSGIEPEFALVTKKFLAGGGEMTFVNALVEPALKRLGCPNVQTAVALKWLKEHGTLEDLDDPYIQKNLAVFDTANPNVPGGRCLDPMAHVKMVAAIQPFLSGAASKTVNLPTTATVADVDRIYREAMQLGVKAIALYRDGSKLTQPLNVVRKEVVPDTGVAVRSEEKAQLRVRSEPLDKTEPPVNGGLHRGDREYLPWRRERGWTQKVKIDGRSVFLRISEYDDGRPGEMFLELAHEGSTLRAMANLVAVAVSIGLQHGVPIAEFVERFVHTKFEPAGIVEGHDRIKLASSIADYLGRELGITYLGRDDLANVTAPDKLEAMVKTAVAAFNEMSEEAKEAMLAAQRESWVRGEMELSKLERETTVMMYRPTGDVCSNCGSLMSRSGTCLTCSNCGNHTGCG